MFLSYKRTPDVQGPATGPRAAFMGEAKELTKPTQHFERRF